MLEVELQPQISRKIIWVLLALLRVSSNSKLALSTAVRDTGNSSKTSKRISWACSVPGWEACGKLKQQQSNNPWPQYKKSYKSTGMSTALLPRQHWSADMHLPPENSQSGANTVTFTLPDTFPQFIPI